MASLAAVLAGVYLGWVQLQRLIYPWYFPPMVLCAAAALPSGLAALGRALARPRAALLLSRALGAVAVVAVGATFVLCLVQTRIGQREVDWGVRAAIGEWLRENTGPTDTILLEPIGYIGYFSGRHILDYPGLVTPEVVRLRRDKGADYVMTIAELRPDWVVVRAEEYQNVMRSDVLRALYRPAGEWNTIPRIEQYPWIPEPRGVVYDAHYVVLRRAG
jgi:hypothetical protein